MTQDTENGGATPAHDEPKPAQVTGPASDELDNAAKDMLAVADGATQAVLDTAREAEATASEAAEESRQQVETLSSDQATGNAVVQTGAQTSRFAFDAGVTAATQALTSFNREAVEVLRANTNASFDLWTSLAGVRTWSEAMTLNANHMRKQLAALNKQSRTLSRLAEKIAVDTIEPLRSSMQRPLF